MSENYYTIQHTEEPPKKKKGKMKTVIALVAAVAIVGGGSGFGGAYLASSLKTSAADNGTDSSGSEYSDGSSDKTNLPGDVSSAIDAINASTSSGVSQKVSASSVVPTGANGAYTASELYEAVNDTIVLIKVYMNQSSSEYGSYYDYFFGYGDEPNSSRKDDEPIYAGYGSGIVFTEDGYILTNAHVVDDAAKLVVEVNDYEDDSKTYEYEATVIGSDTSTDIAVIKIDRSEKFLAAKIGDSDSLKVGQEVCAIGNPGVTGDIMFAHTMTKGIVSGLNRVCLSEGYNLSLIQTDTAINSGNSGGGLFDMYGNVVGVVNSKIITDTFEGIGFALTINEAKPVMEDLLSYGYVKSRPVLGITTIELNEYRAQLYGVKLTKGLLVSAIREDAPVSKSGLRVSDVITKINGTNVETVSDVQTIIGKLHVGDKITATVARANESGTLDSVDVEIELAESSQ